METDIEDRLISTPLATLKELENVIGVAAGSHKVDAIRAVLRGKYLDVLTADAATALQLLGEQGSWKPATLPFPRAFAAPRERCSSGGNWNGETVLDGRRRRHRQRARRFV